MYNGYLETCMPSEAMRKYLKKEYIWGWQAVATIVGAPVSIFTKLEELKKLKEDKNGRKENDLLEDCDGAIRILEKAIEYIELDGIFTVEVVDFDYDYLKPKWNLDMVCGSMDSVKDYIRSELEKNPTTPDDCRWYDVEKWIKDTSGKYVKMSRYYIQESEIIFADVEDDSLDYFGYFSAYYLGDLNLPVPFKAGDILEVDGHPYGPKFRMLILEVGDNRDCCCLQGLARDGNGGWNYGAVKHGHVSLQYEPKIPYLFSARVFEGELDEEEKVLYKVRDCILGDDEKGYKFTSELDRVLREAGSKEEFMSSRRIYTDEMILKAVKKMGGD